jgi:hypothetical protein
MQLSAGVNKTFALHRQYIGAVKLKVVAFKRKKSKNTLSVKTLLAKSAEI